MRIERSAWHACDPGTLHDLIALRIDVFVVEQRCAYRELDGRDVEQGTEHVWTADERGPACYLRVLREPDGALRIGRVCTRADARGRGLAEVLIRDVLERTSGPWVLEAQEQLAGWYGRLGFVPTGPGYLEDGIAHVPMRRGAPVTAPSGSGRV